MNTKKVHLILVGGLAGSGKSDVSSELARITDFAFYDKDTMNGPLVDALLIALNSPLGAADRDTEIYSETVRPVEYLCLMGPALMFSKRNLMCRTY